MEENITHPFQCRWANNERHCHSTVKRMYVLREVWHEKSLNSMEQKWKVTSGDTEELGEVQTLVDKNRHEDPATSTPYDEFQRPSSVKWQGEENLCQNSDVS